jgi:NADPH:quinone reductase
MRAMVVTAFGEPEVLQEHDMPEPAPGEFDLLIEVRATSINPVDTKIRRSGYGPPRNVPCILGFDVAGVIRSMGPRVEGFRAGQAVYASPSLARDGADAELVCVDSRTAALKPASLGFAEAAALPLATITAWESLHKRAAIHPGETVLIHAGGGGVGHIAVQLAKFHGCRVITTASREPSQALCRRLGADVIIDHVKENFIQRVLQETSGAGCPVVFDTVGGDVFDRSLECVATNGRMVTIVRNQSARIVPALFGRNATLHLEFMGVPTVHNIHPEGQGEVLRTVAELVDAGKLKPHVSRVIKLKELPEGHRMLETGHTVGKVAVEVAA